MRLLEPFKFSVFTLKNRAVFSSGAAAEALMRDLWPGGLPMAGLVLPTRLVIDEQAHPIPFDGAFAQALQGKVEQIHATGGHAVAQLWYAAGPAHGTAPTTAAFERGQVERLVERFVEMATLAQAADFDGVELHVAIALPAGSQGQSETEILLEATEAVGTALGMTRVGARLSAVDRPDGSGHAASRQVLFHVAAALDQLGLAWLHLVEPYPRRASVLAGLRRHFGGAIIAEGGHTLETAEAVLDQGLADCVALRPDILADQSFTHPAFAIGPCLSGLSFPPRSV